MAAASGCNWSGSSPVSWITIGSASGSGDGTLTFTVDENRSGGPRSANLSVSGTTLSVTQDTSFTDPTLAAGFTVVNALHLRELRIRIDLLRARLNLPAFAWTDGTVSAGATPIRARHLGDLRTTLTEAYTAAGRTPPSFTDPTITPGQTFVRALHFSELRVAVEALEAALSR
jgi:hypothetical protein